MTSRAILLCTLVLLAAASIGCAKKVTRENYDRIQPGMSLKEVQRILGPGEKVTGAGVKVGDLDISGDVYAWRQDNGEQVGEIVVTFKDGKVVAKSASNLY